MKLKEKIGRHLLGKRITNFSKSLKCAGISLKPELFAFEIFALLVLTLIAVSTFSYFFLTELTYIVAAPVISVVLLLVTTHALISLLQSKRTASIESALPDMLLIMASNLKSGVPTDEAFMLSARPELGILAEKINSAGKMLTSGKTIEDALKSLPKDVNSSVFEQTISLILEGLSSGGELSTVLEATAYDLRDTETINKEIRSVIFVYALFIFIAACLIAPVLYAVSIQLSGILSNLSQSISVQFVTEQTMTVGVSPIEISESFLEAFAYVCIIIISSTSSFIVALIIKGDERHGITYVPIFLGIALILFYIARMALSAFFGGIRVV